MTSRDPLRDLEDALSFQTSPDFGARVRRQVAGQRMQARTFGVGHLALAAAVLIAAAVGVVTMWPARDVNVVAVRPVVVNAPMPSVEPLAPKLISKGPVTVVIANRTQPAFETLVPDDQRRALDTLLAAMRTGRATVPSAVLDEEVNDIGQRVPRALVIEPMKLPLLPGTPGELNKNPGKEPVK